MIFKRIEMVGFKSFADKRVIDFEDGVTAIVGPNGCGKSNVADAIRWVLGEQSSKTLRGSNMQDVIFKGTETRKSLSYCEVSLVFDNTQKTFDLEYDEVVLTRKLYRNGNSEYLINRNPARLKDIIELLHDSGLGKDGYSIIAQGRVTQIINAKPEERRGIFEEAAGIAKFKARKVESERKLDRYRENLTRLNDIFVEVESRIGPLKTQSENAKKFLDLRQNLKHQEVNVYIGQYDSTNEIKQNISNTIDGLDQEISLKENEVDTINKKYNKNMDELQLADINLKNLNEEILNLSLSIQKFSSDNTLFKERLNNIKEQIDKSKITLEAYDKEYSENAETIEQIHIKIDSQKELKQRLEMQVKELTDKYLAVVQELTQSEDANEQANNEMLSAWERLSEIKANLSALNIELEILLKSEKENQEKLISITEKLSQNNGEIETINESVKTVDTDKNKLENDIETNKKQLTDNEFAIKLLERDLQESKTNLQVSKNRKNIISDMQAEFEGYAGSVKRLLQDSNTNSIINKNIIGVVAKLIKVPENLETAIEMALGNALQNIVTKNEDDAKYLINYLKEKRYGRATFLPLTSIKTRSIDGRYQDIFKIKGVLGVANELIEYDRELDKVFAGLLGNTVIANDLETAVQVAKKSNYSFKIVTLEGDIINPAGSLTGGSKKSDVSNLLSRDKEIQRLANEINLLENEIPVKQRELDNLNKEHAVISSELNICVQKLNKINIDFAGVFEKRARFTDFNNRLLEEKYLVEQNIQSANARATEIKTDIESIDELEKTVNNTRLTAGESSKARSVVFDNLKEQKDNYYNSANDLRIKIVATENQLEYLTGEVERLSSANDILQDKIDNEQKTISSNNKIVEDMLSSLGETVDVVKLQKQEQTLNESKKKVSELDKDKIILQKQMIELETERSQLNDVITNLNKKRMAQDVHLQKVDSDLQAMKERIYEEYELTYETCLPLKESGFNVNDGYTQINQIKKEIGKLGSINPNAIEEYAQVCDRYEEMSANIADLQQAESETVQIINDLSKEMLVIFNDQFEKINNNFSKVFRELFGGGNARLELVENEDPLEAGVVIAAQPPGKKLQVLSLLSGGEMALTAIAILFAILKLRPMPFCLLDEIEAALDDANVQRFATYLKRFSQETQFIVITHRKPTMELADSLYGVTMEEKGVSKVVSVKLSDAIKNVQCN